MKLQRIVSLTALAVFGAGLAGCAVNSIVADGSTRSGVMFGSLGIVGHNNNITSLDGSKLGRISIIGDGNTITVEDGVTLRKIEFWGTNNVVSVPANLVIQQSNVGNGNQIIPRGATWTDPNNEFQAADDVTESATSSSGNDEG